MKRIKKNDIVKIIQPGSVYPSYQEMAEKMGADLQKWGCHNVPKGNAKARAKILNIKYVPKINTTFVLIELIEGHQIGNQYLIGADGVKLDTTSQLIAANILGNDMFEI